MEPPPPPPPPLLLLGRLGLALLGHLGFSSSLSGPLSVPGLGGLSVFLGGLVVVSSGPGLGSGCLGPELDSEELLGPLAEDSVPDVGGQLDALADDSALDVGGQLDVLAEDSAPDADGQLDVLSEGRAVLLVMPEDGVAQEDTESPALDDPSGSMGATELVG